MYWIPWTQILIQVLLTLDQKEDVSQRSFRVFRRGAVVRGRCRAPLREPEELAECPVVEMCFKSGGGGEYSYRVDTL